MFQIDRIQPLVACSVCLALSLAVVEWFGAATLYLWPEWMQNDLGTHPRDGYKVAGGQLSEFLSKRTPPPRPFGLVLGASLPYVGIDLQELERNASPHLPWLRLSVFGATHCELEPVVDLLLASQLQPAVVILGLELRMFPRNESYRNATFDLGHKFSILELVDHARHLSIIPAALVFEGLLTNGFNDLIPNRARIRARTQNPLVRLRMAILSLCNQGPESMFNPDWRQYAAVPETMTSQVTPDVLKIQSDENAKRGCYDAKFFSPNGESARSLVKIIQRFKAAGAQVVTVVFPSTTAWRAKEPEIALKTLTDTLNNNFGNDPPLVISLRDALPDNQFVDYYHVNGSGKVAITQRLCQELNKIEQARQPSSP